MQTLIFTGSGGDGIVLAAAATARLVASQGQRTLLASIGPSHGLKSLLGCVCSEAPQTVAPNLDVWELDVLGRMATLLETLRPRLFGVLAQISGDELPTLPGFDLFFGIEYIVQHIGASYDVVVIHAGSHEMFLRAMSVPDGFRWFLRLILGLDRGPGRSADSLNNALISANLLPFEWIGKIQDVRVFLETLRDNALHVRNTTARYVLRPDATGFDEASQALPALQLHGLAVDALVVGPLLPTGAAETPIASVAAHQQDIVTRATQTWQPRPILPLPLAEPAMNIDHLHTLGQTLYGTHNPCDTYGALSPIEVGDINDPFVAIRLPGLPREALSLTLSYEELVVRAGAYRRHILLPDTLRGTNKIKATREGERLIVRLRT
jgi:arsenite/tail-anchored protein-transporting ATPase